MKVSSVQLTVRLRSEITRPAPVSVKTKTLLGMAILTTELVKTRVSEPVTCNAEASSLLVQNLLTSRSKKRSGTSATACQVSSPRITLREGPLSWV